MPQDTNYWANMQVKWYYYVYDYQGTNIAEAKATTNYTTYGVLYNWTAAMNGTASSDTNPSGVQGVCPDGWHLPSDAEWKQLEMYLGMSQVDADALEWRGTDEGGKLKATSGWNLEGNGTNESGFTAFPGGYRDTNGIFINIVNDGVWWSSTEDNYYAYYRGIDYSYLNILGRSSYKEPGFSIRCIKN